ncbi:uncharacterized protein YALI1_D21648g [Yarrowia lipolytica]|uniref:Uncharacterized protein n=1 Tax=Yarrowia lipolytica TaxID=4952 RepID=A0A1D8NEZ7_YARLL|nr:hypothetical protein YALI1_D21648g [Yarrowia lipolytica]
MAIHLVSIVDNSDLSTTSQRDKNIQNQYTHYIIHTVSFKIQTPIPVVRSWGRPKSIQAEELVRESCLNNRAFCSGKDQVERALLDLS